MSIESFNSFKDFINRLMEIFKENPHIEHVYSKMENDKYYIKYGVEND